MSERNPKEYRVPARYRANYIHWNLMRTLSIRQAAYLTLGVEPETDILGVEIDTNIRGKIIKHRFDEIYDLAESWAGSDLLPWNDIFCTKVLPAVWLEWLKRMDISAPKEWDPIKQKDKVKPKPELQRAEALNAAMLMVEQGSPPDSMQDVVNFMRKNSKDFQDCCRSAIKDDSLIKAINQRGGGDPLQSSEYNSVLAQFEADNADNADKIRKLPLIS